MRLQDILDRKGTHVHTIGPEATADDAVAELVRHNIGSLMVCQPAVQDVRRIEVLGIVTERDILRAQAAHRAPLQWLTVVDVMSTRLITAEPTERVEDAMRLMTENRVRHLPIMAHGVLWGLVSIGDIVKAQYDQLAAENFCLRNYIHGERASVELLEAPYGTMQLTTMPNGSMA